MYVAVQPSTNGWWEAVAPAPDDPSFIYEIDVRHLRVGDLVLLRPRGRSSKGSQAVAAGQRTMDGATEDDASWTHVAVYVGSGHVVEATASIGVLLVRIILHLVTLRRFDLKIGKGVRLTPLRHLYARNILRFRRFVGRSNADASVPVPLTMPLGPVRRLRMGVSSMHFIGQPYDVPQIVHLGFEAIRGLLFPKSRPNPPKWAPRRTICSQLYANCFYSATGNYLLQDDRPYLTPAFLSASQDFREVEVRWELAPRKASPVFVLDWMHDGEDVRVLEMALEAYCAKTGTAPFDYPTLSAGILDRIASGIR